MPIFAGGLRGLPLSWESPIGGKRIARTPLGTWVVTGGLDVPHRLLMLLQDPHARRRGPRTGLDLVPLLDASLTGPGDGVAEGGAHHVIPKQTGRSLLARRRHRVERMCTTVRLPSVEPTS